ncbi:MAG: hypothetical protein JWM74_2176, partial [Myxococcaceae bacterium]|nr:hypothetical protein [Myxococcaceae bacterium]
MTASTSPRLAHLTIRSLDTLAADGARSHAFSVPCPGRGLVDVETCRSCPHLARIDVDTESSPGVVHCAPSTPVQPGQVSACVLERGMPSVREDVSLQDLTSFFVQQGLSRVAVVDDDGRLVGVVTDHDLVVGDVLALRHL